MTTTASVNSSPQAAIDFGISNTDIIALVNGAWRRWTEPYTGNPDSDQVRALLAKGGIALADLSMLAVTGGRHRVLPARIRQDTVNDEFLVGSR